MADNDTIKFDTISQDMIIWNIRFTKQIPTLKEKTNLIKSIKTKTKKEKDRTLKTLTKMQKN